jgi:hypothetical protein
MVAATMVMMILMTAGMCMADEKKMKGEKGSKKEDKVGKEAFLLCCSLRYMHQTLVSATRIKTPDIKKPTMMMLRRRRGGR